MEGAITRREVLRRLGILLGGAAAGCAPLRMALHSYPDAFDRDAELVQRTLTAFVHAVIPGITGDPHQLTRVYGDDYYPFAHYRGYFAADLCRRAEALHRESRFDALPLPEREHVIRDGLQSDGITRRLYTGAIFLAQVTCYAGIYDDESGCALIGFEGANDGYDASVITHPDGRSYLPVARTADGNPP